MYGKKYPPQQMIEQYSDDQSQPLVEEVDPDYEPTDKQVRQYAIDTLGMELPQDEKLLYLAKQGLKAPIPPNWVPYQSRDGQIYYKHKITQQKIYDHPTDIEYRKKYEQQKNKMAARNIKSIALKSNLGGGLNQPIGFPNKMNNMSNISNLSQNNVGNFGVPEEQNLAEPTIDPQIQKQYENQLEQLQKREEKKWKEYQEEMQEKHEKKIKKITREYDEELQRIRNQGKYGTDTNQRERKINEEKELIRKRIEESDNASLQEELKLIQKNEQAKLQQFIGIYEEDKKIKLKKLEDELQRNYQEKKEKFQEFERIHNEKRQQKRRERERILQELRQKMNDPHNPQMIREAEEALQEELEAVRQSQRERIRIRQNQLQTNYNEIKKMLGLDSGHHLQEIAQKKARFKLISDQKIKAYKEKQQKKLNQEYLQKYERKEKQLSQKLAAEFQAQKTKTIRQCENELEKNKEKIDMQINEQAQKRLQEIYQQNALKLTRYETSMNKKMSEVRMKFIENIQKDKGKKSSAIADKILMKEREQRIANKEQIIKNLQRSLQIQKGQQKILLFQKELQENIDSADRILKQKLRSQGLQYKPPAYMQRYENYEKLKKKYQGDKKILSQILRNMQSTSIYPFYEKQRQSRNTYNDQFNDSSSALIKKYNVDVRKMRENEEMLRKYEIALKKAQINEEALEELMRTEFNYEQIALKEEIGLGKGIQEFDERQTPKKIYDECSKYEAPSYKNVDNALKEHSKFLATVKNQLNRKLYQVRSSSYYNY